MWRLFWRDVRWLLAVEFAFLVVLAVIKWA